MLSQGDEFGRTQRGNNNAYCQDSDLSYVDWSLAASNQELLDFTRELFRIVRSHRALRRRHFFQGRTVGGELGSDFRKDVTWLRADGREMADEDWMSPKAHSLGMLIRGDLPDQIDELGHPLQEPSLYLFLNATARAKTYTLPALGKRGTWRELLNTAQPPRRLGRAMTLSCAPHALNLLSYEWTIG